MARGQKRVMEKMCSESRVGTISEGKEDHL